MMQSLLDMYNITIPELKYQYWNILSLILSFQEDEVNNIMFSDIYVAIIITVIESIR